MKAPGWILLAAAMVALAVTACGGAGSAPPVTPNAGDELVIVTPTPGTPPVADTQTPARRYVVAEGDTLSGIAARFGVTEEALQTANGVADPNRLVAGQELIVPVDDP